MLNNIMSRICDIVSQKDVLFLIFNKLDYKTICVLKTVNKSFKQIADEADDAIYRTDIYEPFLEYRTSVYEFILTNVMYLTMNENASIYFEFLENVYNKYRVVFIRETDVIPSLFSFMVLFHPFLQNEDDYKELYETLNKHMFIPKYDFDHMDTSLIKKHVDFKYNSLFSSDELNAMSVTDMRRLLCN